MKININDYTLCINKGIENFNNFKNLILGFNLENYIKKDYSDIDSIINDIKILSDKISNDDFDIELIGSLVDDKDKIINTKIENRTIII